MRGEKPVGIHSVGLEPAHPLRITHLDRWKDTRVLTVRVEPTTSTMRLRLSGGGEKRKAGGEY